MEQQVAFYALDDLSQDDLSTASARLTAAHVGAQAASAQLERTWLGKDLETVHKMAQLAESLASGSLSTRTAIDTRALLRYMLDTFGRARSGFTPRKPHSQPDNDQARSYRGACVPRHAQA